MCNSSASSLESRAAIAPPRIETRRQTALDLDAIRALSADCGYSPTGLAARLGISVRQLQRMFARQVGCAPRDWLREERLQVAHRLLLRASSIKEVALTLSFRQESQFSRDFRRRFGYTASTLQKSWRSPGPRLPPRQDACPQACF